VSREQLLRLRENRGRFPIEICRHDVVAGLSYWPIVTLDDWGDVCEWLQREPGAYLLSYRWDGKGWRHLWTVDDLGWDDSHMVGVVWLPHSQVDWDAVDALDAREVAREYRVSSAMRSRPMYRGTKLTDRSGWMWRIACDMRAGGASCDEIACVLWNSEMSKDRRRDRYDSSERRHIEGEIQRLMRKKG
jgi:hypothetical protein